jgi:hypothetical protein
MSKTIKALAKEAISVQDACNLSGVVHSFSRAMTDLRGIVGGMVNHHPIAIVWADKVASLTGIQDFGNDVALEAHRIVSDLADGE